MKHVICHYHIYKNSGTTFDKVLTENFGERHILFDGPFPYFNINQNELEKVILRNANAVAFSSHQILLPAPASLDVNIIPVIFVRHPLLRVKSIYKFKRQTFDGTITSKNAQGCSFSEWVELCFSDRQEITHISNAQTRILSFSGLSSKPLMRRKGGFMEYDVYQAKRNLNNVELLARTEFFEQDVTNFKAVLAGYGIDFHTGDLSPKNVTDNSHTLPLAERLDKVKSELGDAVYNRLVEANQQDIAIYDFVSGKLGN